MTLRQSDYPASPGQQQRHAGLSNAKLLSICGVVLFAIVSWAATAATTELAKLSDRVTMQGQEIAILKESQRNTRDTLFRMEAVLEDIRRQLQQERRR